jgi:uncharacterized membrane protein
MRSLRVADAWMGGAGVAGRALVGLTGFLASRRVRAFRAARIHLLGNATVIVPMILNVCFRTTAPSAAEAVLPWVLTLSAAVVTILVVTGWFGCELVHRHGVNLAGHEGVGRPP